MEKQNRTIYIFDIIGSHSGMHYYDNAFQEVLRKKGFDTVILSNFHHENDSIKFVPQLFNRHKIVSLLLILWVFVKFIFFVLTRKSKNAFIFLTYGVPYELPFLLLGKFNKNFYVDIHELYAHRYSNSKKIIKLINYIYINYINKVIVHSERTKKLLVEINFKGDVLFVPHFKYMFDKRIIEQNISYDISSKLNSENIKFLFFGNITKAKGIEIIIDSFSKLLKLYSNVTLIIAGKNLDNIDITTLKNNYKNCHVFDRHINDDELKYLYKNTDYVLLPYIKSSQSGIFEMAIFFRKPMILSDIPYFKKMLSQFPSFGILSPLEKYEESIAEIIKNGVIKEFYSKVDCEKNELSDDIYKFMAEFCKSLN